MSEHAKKFVNYLQGLKKAQNRGALAALRHSLAFAPGVYPPAYPYVERFVPLDSHAQDSFRLALYIVAGLYAFHPEQRDQSFASSLGEVLHRRGSSSLERRFVSLLGADPENLADYLRHSASLLAAEGIGCDYAALIDDVSTWLNSFNESDRRDLIRQRWARDFYRHAQPVTEAEPANQEKDD